MPGLVLGLLVLLAPQGVHALTLAGILAAGLTLGCLLLTLLQHMVHAKWGVLLLERFEAGGGPLSLGVVALALLPAIVHPAAVYDWARGGHPDQAWWLSPLFFQGRSVFYLLLWAGLAVAARRATVRGDYATNVAAPGFFFTCLTGTFASFDWAMSLEVPYASTVYGMLFLTVGVMGAMGVCVAVACATERSPRFDEPLRRDYGNLLFTFLMVWGYLTIMQYIISWSGNIRTESDYFLRRAVGLWLWLGDGLVGVGFFGPFFLLLTPRVRNSTGGLGFAAGFVAVVWAGFVVWLVGPALAAPWWLDVAAVAGVGMLWTGAFAFQSAVPVTRRALAHA